MNAAQRKKLALTVCEYVASWDREEDDYLSWCAENGRDPKDLERNQSHVFAAAHLALDWDYEPPSDWNP